MTDDNALERRLDRLGIRRDDDWVDRYLLCNHLVDPGDLDLQRHLALDPAAEERPLDACSVARQVDDQRADLAIPDHLPAQGLDTDARTRST